jgi:hypothetical protein
MVTQSWMAGGEVRDRCFLHRWPRRFILFTQFPGDNCVWCLTSATLSLSILGTVLTSFSGRLVATWLYMTQDRTTPD